MANTNLNIKSSISLGNNLNKPPNNVAKPPNNVAKPPNNVTKPPNNTSGSQNAPKSFSAFNNLNNLNNLNNNLSNLSNLNKSEILKSGNAKSENAKSEIAKSENAKSENNKSILSKGLESIGDTFSDIKNTLIGRNNSSSLSNKKNNMSEKINMSQKENLSEKKNLSEKENMSSKKNNSEKSEKENNSKKENTSTKIKSYIVSVTSDSGDSMTNIIVKIIVMVVVLVALYYVGRYLLVRYQSPSVQTPYLLNGTKNGKNALVISQDPTSVNYIPINKSEGQDGIQFTYGFWFLLEGFDYKKGEWKHMFHKGGSTSYPNRAPGVWIHPDKNAIRVYMNTLGNIFEYVDVENLPIKKWVYMNIILNNTNLDLYINGYLKIRKELTALPKQNDDDFWINMFGGFEGYLSNIRYYSYAIDFNEINSMIKAGPSINNCINTNEVPPYLDDNWWFDYEAL